MCFGGGRAARASADAAAREQARQAEIERQRLAEEARIAKAEADARYAEEQRRQDARLAAERADAEALRKQIADQEAFRLSELARIEAARKAERDADIARQTGERNADLERQQKERADAEAAAAARAGQLSEYNTSRQGIIDAARRQIEQAFGAYGDDYFNSYADQYVAAQKPKIAQQYDDAKRATTFDFARRGNLRSTAAARTFGKLDQTRAEAEGDVAQQAASAANQYRQGLATQRANALNGIFGAVNAAPVITADNVGEANNSLRYLSTAITSPVQLAASTAAGFAPPQPGQLGQIFNLPGQTAAAPRTGSASNGASLPTSRTGSGRLVA